MGGCALFAWLAVLPPSGSADLLAEQGGALMQGLLRDPLAILSDRSPGARQPGVLVQSKPHMAIQPSERVLSPVRERPASPIPANLDNLDDRAKEVINPGSPLAAGGPGSSIPAPFDPPAGSPGFSGGIIPPGTGGGGSNGGGGNPPPPGPPPPPIVTPVPEPATWIMMIVGVGLIGIQLRRRGGARPATAA